MPTISIDATRSSPATQLEGAALSTAGTGVTFIVEGLKLLPANLIAGGILIIVGGGTLVAAYLIHEEAKALKGM